MVMERRLLTLLAETSVHAGGPDSVALVDLPIQREATTRLPVIWGQSLKGALRQAARDAGWSPEETTPVFGSPPPRRAAAARNAAEGSGGAAGDMEPAAGDDEEAFGDGGAELVKGSLAVGDAQLVALPAATLRNTFAWVTGPLQLSRLRRKIRLIGLDDSAALAVSVGDGQAAGTAGWAGRQVFGGFLENVLQRPEAARVGTAVGALVCPNGDQAFDYTRDKLSTDLVCVEDTLMAGLSERGIDIVARVQLNSTAKTVANGPFYSEHLPAETVLAALLAGDGEHLNRLAALLDGKPLQLGGDETVGKGLLWCRIHSADTVRAALTGAEDAAAAGSADAPAGGPSGGATGGAGGPTPGVSRRTPADVARRNRG
jgi:CRISPR-associated protein Cmr4